MPIFPGVKHVRQFFESLLDNAITAVAEHGLGVALQVLLSMFDGL